MHLLLSTIRERTLDSAKVCFDLANKHLLELKNQTTDFELTVF